MKRLPLLFSLLAVIALSASIAYWFMALYKPKQHAMAAIVDARPAEPLADAGATLFGGQASAVVISSYKLTGVVSAGREGVAILVADGQPPKALQVGKEIASGVVLKEVWPKYVMLSEGGVLKRIDLATDATAGANLGLAVPTAEQYGQPQMQQQYQQQPPPTPMPVPVPEDTSVPVPSNQPMEVPTPPGVPPPPPPPAEMPAPTRNFSTQPGGNPPTQ
jgi:general secretion pathway protein C